MSLLPVKKKLYEIFKVQQQAEPDSSVVNANQQLGVNVSRAMARDSNIMIFQQQNVAIQQTFSIVVEALEMLDGVEYNYPEIFPQPVQPVAELPEEGDDAFKGLAEFSLLAFKRGATWREVKRICMEAYFRTTIKNSRSCTEAADRLGIQRTYLSRMTTLLGIKDKPIDRR